MKFYNRIDELKSLAKIHDKSKEKSQMTMIVGRRRIGKTELIKKAYKDTKFIYLFVSKKNEALLCSEFIEIINQELGIKTYGEITKFNKLFEYIMELSKNQNFTLAIDEFQDFFFINPSIYSDMQNIWDSNKNNDTKLNLILCGSIYSLMNKIFENYKEPLFGRINNKIVLKTFNIDTLKEIITEHYPKYEKIDLLAFYIFTGGVAKYVEIFVDNNAFTFEKMLDIIFEDNSTFIEEGKNILIEEFGKEYSTYFSILSLISSSKTARTEIESILEKNIGGYLDRLEKEYGIIRKVKPIFSKEGSRTQKYLIEDNFLNFWFRFIYKYRSAIEIENYESVKDIVKRDFKTYSGRFLEKYFIQKLTLSKKYTTIGSYWSKKSDHEIDIVAVNEIKKTALIIEVKLNDKKIDLVSLEKRSSKFLQQQLKNYNIKFKKFSLKDI